MTLGGAFLPQRGREAEGAEIEWESVLFLPQRPSRGHRGANPFGTFRVHASVLSVSSVVRCLEDGSWEMALGGAFLPQRGREAEGAEIELADAAFLAGK
jgi:hypothetical protein